MQTNLQGTVSQWLPRKEAGLSGDEGETLKMMAVLMTSIMVMIFQVFTYAQMDQAHSL